MGQIIQVDFFRFLTRTVLVEAQFNKDSLFNPSDRFDLQKHFYNLGKVFWQILTNFKKNFLFYW